MSKVSPRKLSSDQKMKSLDILWTSIASLRAREEVKSFFKDLLTPTESIMLGRRLQIAQMLLEGKGYNFICEEIGTSKATIASVHQWLSSGFGGYEKALKRFEDVVDRRFRGNRKRKMAPMSFEWLKNKYPLHFLLFNLMSKSKK